MIIQSGVDLGISRFYIKVALEAKAFLFGAIDSAISFKLKDD